MPEIAVNASPQGPKARARAMSRLVLLPRPDAAPVATAGARRRPLGRKALPLLDTLVAAALALWVFGSPVVAAVYAALTPLAVGTLVGYRNPPIGPWAVIRAVLRLSIAPLVAGWAAATIVLGRGLGLENSHMLTLWALTTLAWIVTRLLVVRAERRRPERVVVVGSGDLTGWLGSALMQHGNGRFNVVGYLDDEPPMSRDHVAGVPHLGGVEELEDLLALDGVDRLVVGFSSQPDERMLELLRDCDKYGVHVDIVPRLFQYLGRAPRTYALGGVPIMTVPPRREGSFEQVLKRAIDIVAASSALVLVAPVFVAVALAIKLSDRGPVFYGQRRIGQGGRPFRIWKFRSMSVDADRHDAMKVAALRHGKVSIGDAVAAIKHERDPRVTRIGQFLRETSIDELPQLWNVVRGEMSLVGPRPLRDFEVESLSSWEQRRHLKRPGITGLWQVAGRSNVSWAERMHLDYTYVRHWSLSDDLEILARTVPAVLARDGAR
jgi:exopolysaccharide biosynthesis polyprenyl glycosylphosphotransferase